MYVEYGECTQSTGNIHRVRGMDTEYGEWTQSTGNGHGVRDCISLYVEYKLSMSYDTESP